jgi:hypothetical protein
MTAIEPLMGVVYDVGGAMALAWPDHHPCHDTPEHGPWLILHADGGIEWAPELRENFKLMGYLPGFDPALAHIPTDVELADRKVWNELRAAALGAFASSLGYPSWRAYCTEDLESGVAASRQIWEIVRTAMKGVLPIVERQAAELDAALGGEARARRECNELYEEIALLKRELANAQQAYNRTFDRMATIENEEQGR